VYIAGAMNANSQMMAGLLGHLNPQVIAGIVNDNTDWIAQLQMAMDSEKTASAINQSSGFLTSLVSKLDPAVVAQAINANPESSSKIMRYLNVDVIAGVVNSNGTFLTNLVKSLNTTVLANALNANPDMTTQLLSHLQPSVIANVVNNNGTFVTNLMNRMNPATTAAAINANQDFLTRLLQPDADPVTPGVQPGVNPTVLTYAVNNNQTFLNGLIANLDARSTAEPMNSIAGEQFSERLMHSGNLDPKMVAGLLNGNGAFISGLLSHLNPQTIADAVNGNQPFLTTMMTYMNPADISDVINNNLTAQQTINTLVGLLDGGVISGAMNAHPELTTALLAAPPAGINPDILTPLLATPQVRNFLGLFLGSMSPSGTKTLLANSGNFIGNLLNRTAGGINPDVIVNAIAGPNHAGTNPTTGTAWNPNQNVLRKVWMYGATKIIFGWELPAMGGWVQIVDARRNTTPGQPLTHW
jgi:hypothetical protein